MSASRMGAVNAPTTPRSQSVFKVHGAGCDASGAGIIRAGRYLLKPLLTSMYSSLKLTMRVPSLKVTELVQVTKQTKAHDQGLFSYRPAQDRDDLASEPIFFST